MTTNYRTMKAALFGLSLFLLGAAGCQQAAVTAPSTVAPAREESPVEWAWAGPSLESTEDGRTYRVLVDDSTAARMSSRGVDMHVLEFIPPKRIAPIAQRYLKSVGVVAAEASKAARD